MTAVPSLAERPEGRRSFTDADGVSWTLAEEPIPLADWTSADEDSHRAGYAVGWLHFTCVDRRKRLRLYPARWWTLSDAQLDRLSRRASAFHPDA